MAALVVAAIWLACKDSPTFPDPRPPPPVCELEQEDCPGQAADKLECECKDIEFHAGVPFQLTDTRVILAFPGTQAEPHEIAAFSMRASMAGWPRVTHHTCVETVEWENTPWADFFKVQMYSQGFAADSIENLSNLRRFLNATAVLGDQVLLDIFCTVRDNQQWMDANAVHFAGLIGDIVAPYNHVAIHIANEPWHPNSWFNERRAGSMKLREVYRALREHRYGGLIGADDHIGSPELDFSYQYTFLDWADFHPYREPVPTRGDLRRMRDLNPQPVWLSEIIAWSTWRDSRCCTDSKEVVRDYIFNGEDLGLIMSFHSTCGLGNCDGGAPGRFAYQFDWIYGEP